MDNVVAGGPVDWRVSHLYQVGTMQQPSAERSEHSGPRLRGQRSEGPIAIGRAALKWPMLVTDDDRIPGSTVTWMVLDSDGISLG